jgi:hypothetical protein
MNILVITKDIGGGFNTHRPVVDLLKQRGHDVTIVAEGLSMQKWIDAGYKIFGGLPDNGCFDPDTKIRFDLDPQKTIDIVDPDVVITELADPIHLGEKFGLVAGCLGIPVVFIEDLWGAHKRSKAVPNLLCSVDQYGLEQAQLYYGVEERFFHQIVVTGNPAMDSISNEKPHPVLQKWVAEEKLIHVLFGQDDSTTPAIQGLVSSLVAGDCLVARFHPKWMSDPSKKEHINTWLEALEFAKSKGVEVLDVPEGATARQLILAARSCVSIYSTVLTEAALLGSLAVSWMSPVGQQRIKESMGVERYPLVDLGCVAEVYNPDEYNFMLMKRSVLLKNCREQLHPDGKNTERVVEAIEILVK